jgi:putative DeoR family transcriptional regulator (stage III sporulation protein D)
MSKIEQRIINEANYILENKTTIRKTAKYFNMSKTTIHNDLYKKLKNIDINLFDKIQKLMKHNKEMAHINGGIATKLKFERTKNK